MAKRVLGEYYAPFLARITEEYAKERQNLADGVGIQEGVVPQMKSNPTSFDVFRWALKTDRYACMDFVIKEGYEKLARHISIPVSTHGMKSKYKKEPMEDHAHAQG